MSSVTLAAGKAARSRLLRDSTQSSWPQAFSCQSSQHIIRSEIECREACLWHYRISTYVTGHHPSCYRLPTGHHPCHHLRRDFVTAPPKRVVRKSSNKLDKQEKRQEVIKSHLNTELPRNASCNGTGHSHLTQFLLQKFRSGLKNIFERLPRTLLDFETNPVHQHN